MEKYKLIKEYPGSPEFGTELRMKGTNSYHTLDGKKTFNGLLPERYPEYWERLSEEDYEILSIKVCDHYSGSRVLEEWTPENKISLDAMLNLGNCVHSRHYYIHSVKRLSDGEVFTVGDNVLHKNPVTNRKGQIKSFEKVSDKIFVNTTSFNTPLVYIELDNKPLFTTEDGVSIYGGDKIFSVNRHTFQHCDSNRRVTANFSESSVYKYFSSKEAAEEYILMNKPCLSLNDVNNSEGMNRRGFRYLKELVKSKSQLT